MKSLKFYFSLLGACTANPELLQSLHLVLGIIAYLFDSARVYNEPQTVDCDRGFGDVSAEYAFANTLWSNVEYLLLVLDRQSRVQR